MTAQIYKLTNPSPEKLKESHSLHLRNTVNGLKVTGEPSFVANLHPNDQVLYVDSRLNRNYIFIKRGGMAMLLGSYDENGFTDNETQLFPVNGENTQVVHLGDFLVFYCPEKTVYLHFANNGYHVLGEEPEFPVFAFSTTAHFTLSEHLPAYNFVASYPQWAGTLGIDDRKNLSALVNSSFKNLKQKAKNYSSCIQPIVFRVAMRLFDDSLLWDKFCYYCGKDPFCPSSLGKVTMLESSQKFRLETTSLSIEIWKPAISLVKSGIGNWKGLVKSVEFYATAEQDIISEMINFRCERTQMGKPEYFLRITPVCPNKTKSYRKIADTDKFRLVASISNISALLEHRIEADGMCPIVDNSAGDLSHDTYALDIDNTILQKTDFSNHTKTFQPQATTNVAERCFAGNLSFRLPLPTDFESLCDPSDFSGAETEWIVSVEIETASGKANICKQAKGQGWSRRLARILSYPDRRATHITILAKVSGQAYSFTTELRPSDAGDFALALSPCEEPFMLSETATPPALHSTNTVLHNCCDIISSRISNPLIWNECKSAGNQGVVALLPSYGYRSSWLPGKHAVSLFATDGIYLLSFDTSGKCTGSSLISSRKIKDRDCLAMCDEGAVFSDSYGEICFLKGATIKSSGFSFPAVRALGYSSHYKEIWVEQEETFSVLEHNGTCYDRNRDNRQILNHIGKFLLSDHNTLYNPQQERGMEQKIEFTSFPLEIPLGKRIESVIWNIFSPSVNLLLAVYAENGRSCHGELISSLKITGELYAPFYHKLYAPPTRTVRLSVKGYLPSDTRIDHAIVYLKLYQCNNSINSFQIQDSTFAKNKRR